MERVSCFLIEQCEGGYRRVDNPADVRPHSSDFEPGAMYFNEHYADRLCKDHPDYQAFWLKHYHLGPDGKVLLVKLPNEMWWNVDGRASNCDKKDDNEHACWVRHGEAPNITVDKQGLTCGAGAGSIDSTHGTYGNWHGFLQNGVLVKC